MIADRANASLKALLQEAEERYVAANPQSHVLYRRACESLPGGNTRTVLFYTPFPLTIERAQDALVWDADGHLYSDFLGEFTAGLYGHSNQVIRDAIVAAVEGGIVLSGPNRIESELAALLCSRFPALQRVRFCNSGTEANLFAVTTAAAVTRRGSVLTFEGGYHGGVLNFSSSASMRMNAPFRWIVGQYNDLEGTIGLIERNADDLAAVLVEPLMGNAGCIPAEPEFLSALRRSCDDQGIVLIFDEVMTSRLSSAGLHGALGVTPDLVTLGKYIGGGLPLGAFGGRADLMDRFDPRRPDALIHAGTFNNNIASMAAGRAGLSQVLTAAALDSVNAAGDALRKHLNMAARAHGLAVQFTGRGSMMSFTPVGGTIRRPADVPVAAGDLRTLFHFDMLARGQYMARRGMINLSLPITAAQLNAFADAVEDFFIARRGVLPRGAAS